VRELIIEDDTFTANTQRVTEICRLLIGRGLHRKIRWLCNARVNLDYETMALMKKAGCHLIIPGIESVDQTILNNIHKGTTVAQIKKFVSDAKKAGLCLIPAEGMLSEELRKRGVAYVRMGDQSLPAGVKGKYDIMRYGAMSVKNIVKSLRSSGNTGGHPVRARACGAALERRLRAIDEKSLWYGISIIFSWTEARRSFYISSVRCVWSGGFLPHWEDWLYFKARGCSIYDWGGVFAYDSENGIDRFKTLFGGTPHDDYHTVPLPNSLLGKISLKIYALLSVVESKALRIKQNGCALAHREKVRASTSFVSTRLNGSERLPAVRSTTDVQAATFP
jgi:hypothetical protein